MAQAEKDRMLDLILGHTDYSPDQRRAIQDYNRVDVEETVALLSALAPGIDLPRALHRGRFMAAIAREEQLGLPVDTDALARLVDNWERLQLHYIARDDDLGLYDDITFASSRLRGLGRRSRLGLAAYHGAGAWSFRARRWASKRAAIRTAQARASAQHDCRTADQ